MKTVRKEIKAEFCTLKVRSNSVDNNCLYEYTIITKEPIDRTNLIILKEVIEPETLEEFLRHHICSEKDVIKYLNKNF